jgi:hypothetical protein
LAPFLEIFFGKMPPISKGRRRSQSNLAQHRYAIRMNKIWKERLEEMNEGDLGNKKGRSRSFEENKLILLTLKMLLNVYLRFIDDGKMSVFTLSWTMLE